MGMKIFMIPQQLFVCLFIFFSLLITAAAYNASFRAASHRSALVHIQTDSKHDVVLI